MRFSGRVLAFLTLSMLLGAAESLRAQQVPAGAGGEAVGELVKLLAEAKGEERERVLARVRALPESALEPIERAIESDTTSPFARADLQRMLPELLVGWSTRRREAMDRRDQELFESGAAEYQQVGVRDAKWDAQVLAAFKLPADDGLRVHEGFKAAVEAGCADPLVLYFYHSRSSGEFAQAARLMGMRDAVAGLEKSAYSPIWKFGATVRLLRNWTPSVGRLRLEGNFDGWGGVRKALGLVPEVVAARPSRRMLHALTREMYDGAAAWALGKRQPAFDQVFPVFERALGAEHPVVLNLQAVHYKDWAWEARGGDYAGQVTEEGWRLFRERLVKAQEFAERGYAADPWDSRFAEVMIPVCMGKGGDRAEMEKWFERAMRADPESYAACDAKLYYLYPRWHGSAEEMLAFGRECVSQGTARSRIPSILVMAHEEVRSSTRATEAYFRDPVVWRDLESAFKKLLTDAQGARRADTRRYRGQYFMYAVLAERWPLVKELGDAYGTEVDPAPAGGIELYTYYRKKAAREVANR